MTPTQIRPAPLHGLGDFLLVGWDEIAAYLRRPVNTVRLWKNDMIRDGVLFWDLFGVPPKRKIYICGFASDIKAWRKKFLIDRRKIKTEKQHIWGVEVTEPENGEE